MSKTAILRPRIRTIHFVILALSCWSATALGQPKGHKGPPPEALAACSGLKSGDACSFSGRRGKAKGSCFAPKSKPLACRPDRTRAKRKR